MRLSASIAVSLSALLCVCVPLAAEDAVSQAPADAAAQAGESAPQHRDILKRAEEALAQAQAIQADIRLEVFYPAHYASTIDLLADPSGDERAEMETTVNSDSYKSIEVISNGILWSEQDTPAGKMVTKIDVSSIKKSLRKTEGSVFAALPILGTNALFDLTAMSHLVDFTESAQSSLDGVAVYVLTGRLAAKFADGKATLPAGAERYYRQVAVYIDADGFFPRRIELGSENGKPLVALDFLFVRKNVSVPEGAFSYSPPEDAQVVDATDWALSKLTGD